MTQREILSVRAPLLAFALAGLFAGCQSTGPTASSLSASATAFSASDAAFIKKSGTGKIAGHAFWRDGKGGVVNAAGEIVRLVPATAYAKERFATLYKGGRSVPVNMVAQVDSDPAYAEYTRTTRAESSGRFEFEGVRARHLFRRDADRLEGQGLLSSLQIRRLQQCPACRSGRRRVLRDGHRQGKKRTSRSSWS